MTDLYPSAFSKKVLYLIKTKHVAKIWKTANKCESYCEKLSGRKPAYISEAIKLRFFKDVDAFPSERNSVFPNSLFKM